MKTIYILFIVGVISVCCNVPNDKPVSAPQSIAVTLLVDVTDRKLLWPTAAQTLQIFHCDAHPDAACRFRLQVISDKRTNPSFSSFLPNGTTSEKENRDDDMQFRKKTILAFYENVRNSFTDCYTQFDTAKSMQHSEVWATTCNALQELSLDSSTEKYLIIYSDLQEQSMVGNAYTSFSRMSGEAIAAQLNNTYSVPQNLLGITILIVYQPYDRADDIRFNRMLSAYSFLLEKRGAVVKEQANYTSYE